MDESQMLGLRARKRQETREKIAKAGMKMFIANGFEATTLDMIAAAADISRRTFFHYFDSKEAIFTAWEGDLDEETRAAIADQPEGATPFDTVSAALHRLSLMYATDEAFAVDRLMRSTEALRARKQANYERQERALFAALAERWDDPERRFALRLIAMVGIGAMRVAIEKWRNDQDGNIPLRRYLDAAFATLRTEIETRVTA